MFTLLKAKIAALIEKAAPADPLAYAHDIARDFARKRLDQYIVGCTDCECCAMPKSITYGNARAKLLVVCDVVPEEYIDNHNAFVVAPLFGTKAGEYFQQVLDYCNVDSDKLFYINSINCLLYKEVGGNKIARRTPYEKELKNCRHFVDYAIDIVRPAAILLLGNVALSMFFPDLFLNKARGKWLKINDIPALATYSPDYILRMVGIKNDDIIEELNDYLYDDVEKMFRYVEALYPNSIKKKVEGEQNEFS